CVPGDDVLVVSSTVSQKEVDITAFLFAYGTGRSCWWCQGQCRRDNVVTYLDKKRQRSISEQGRALPRTVLTQPWSYCISGAVGCFQRGRLSRAAESIRRALANPQNLRI